ncbi:MAG: sulfide/dihydroorotate dehydrogenase-like FAD/NAD-binding protein, partial [Eubacterium sp.]
MYKIVKRQQLNDTVVRLDVQAPFIAKKAKAGQFIIFRIDEHGERIPLTIADTDAEKGTVSIIFQIVGQSTMLLSQLQEGDAILDFVGPLGAATEFGDAKKVCVIGGGVGNAIAYPSAKALFNMGADVDVIAGFRSKDIVILEDEFKAVCNRLFITTDDGTYGEKGFVTNKLQELIDAGNNYDLVIAIGPIPMMKFVSKVTELLMAFYSRHWFHNPLLRFDGNRNSAVDCRSLLLEAKSSCTGIGGPSFDGVQKKVIGIFVANAAAA